MIKCKAGFYNDQTFNECQACPENFYCPSSGTSRPVPCPQGYTCPNVATDWTLYDSFANVYQELMPEGGTAHFSSFPCPLYHECPDGLVPPKICDDNYYSDEYGAVQCKECKDGFTCQDGKISELCPTGKYCRSADGSFPCPKGYFNPNEGASIDIFDPSGSGQDDAIAIDNGLCLICPAGFMCNQSNGTTTPQLCPAGFYCKSGTSDSPIICPTGNYCPIGSVEQKQCPIGTFNDQTQRSTLADCLPCPEGKYCDKPALNSDRNLPNCATGKFLTMIMIKEFSSII